MPYTQITAPAGAAHRRSVVVALRTSVVTLAVACLSLTAFGGNTSISQAAPATSARALAAIPTTPVAGRVQPTAVKPAKQITIAVIGIVNNPFWQQVKVGFDRAAAVLGARGAKVEWVDAGSQVTVQAVGGAINAQVASGVNGILSLVPGDGICTYIKYSVGHHVAFATINGDATCAQKSGSLFFHGQDLYGAGVTAGKLMCQATAALASKSKPGVVGVSTESLAFQALVERANGFVAGLKANCPWVTALTPVQDNADPATIQSNVRSFISSTPNLVGVYMTGGNPYVAATALCAQHKQAAVKFVAFDFTTQNVAAIRSGCMTAAIGQDPFGQSYDSVMYMYNYLVTGKHPAKYFIPTAADVATKSNINKVVAAQASGAPGI